MYFKNILVYSEKGWLPKNVFLDFPCAGMLYVPQPDGSHNVPSSLVDMQEQYIWMPGIFDTHIHGIAGHDFSEGTLKAYSAITESLGKQGVSYCAATYVSMDLNQLKDALKVLDAFISSPQKKGFAKIIAVHLEGPFIAKNCKGAHDEKVLQKEINLKLFLDIIAAAPHVTNWKLTLAPELPGVMEFIEQTRDLKINGEPIGVHVFIGHSNAEEQIVQMAVKRGVAGFTHLGNANCETAHRTDRITNIKDFQSHVVRFALGHHTPVELIVDGQHLSQSFVAFVNQQLPYKIILVSDALSPTAMPDGEYCLGTLAVIKQGKRIVLKDNPTKLAGSVSLLPDSAKNFLAILKDTKLNEYTCLTALYHAMITNPRATSLCHSDGLNNETDFVILDRKTGQLMLSSCSGLVTQHLPFLVPKKHNEQGLFKSQSSTALSGFRGFSSNPHP